MDPPGPGPSDVSPGPRPAKTLAAVRPETGVGAGDVYGGVEVLRALAARQHRDPACHHRLGAVVVELLLRASVGRGERADGLWVMVKLS